ncbi:HRDC domain-containing protein, partial [Neisseria sp. P0021.S007]|uniref:HRDC domain-containing protein n=1 Tax=Neisseria sp. P0021.S007 TaxID=3436822 RepID=UPI003F7D168B
QTEREQQLQQKLETWRAEQAATEQCALGKVLSNISLTDLVVFTPAEEADLLGIYGIGSERIAQYGQAILDICRSYADGLSEPKQAERQLARRLFQWCLDTARYEGGEMHAVAKKQTLRAIAKAQPQTLTALSKIDDVSGEWLDKYGEEIIEI